MKVYISGQITGIPFEVAQDMFSKGAGVIKAMDYEPVSPLEVIACEEEVCGDGSRLPNGHYHHSWHCYMRHDLKMLLDCHAIVMLPNWRESRGAMFERETAIVAGIEVRYFDHEIEKVY